MLTSAATILALGFVMGLRHALEADHIAAVATLSAQNVPAKRAIRYGAVWGIGHTLMLLAVTAATFFLGQGWNERVSHYAEIGVAVLLMVLGVRVVITIIRKRIHIHRHRHDDGVEHYHVHSHEHAPAKVHGDHDHAHQSLSGQSLMIGLIHGLAGSALLVVLVSAQYDSWIERLGYVAIFGVGSIVGMALLSLVVALPLRALNHSVEPLYRALNVVVGVFSIAVGGRLLLATLGG